MSLYTGKESVPDDIETLIRPRPRVRSGCLTCRKRKVKCDEQRPHCHNCTRLRRTCIYVETSNSPRRGADYRGGPVDLTRRSTTDIAEEATMMPTTPSGDLSVQSPPPLALTGTETWTTPLNLFGFGTNADLSVQDQSGVFGWLESSSSPTLPWSNMALSNEAPFPPGPSLTPVMNDTTPFLYFLEQVDPPFIANVDGINWKTMKRYMVELGCHHATVSQAISAVEMLYETKINCKDPTSSMASYYVAKSGYASMLERNDDGPEIVLVVTFLLCCFEIVAQHETVPITLKPEGPLVAKLEAWAENTTYAWSPVLRRLQAWFQIFHTRTMHLGGPGLLSPKVDRLLKCECRQGPIPGLGQIGNQVLSPEQAILGDLANKLFEFYLEVSMISTQIASLNRHHRSRGFQADEREVQIVAEELQEMLHHLWQRRPALLRTDRGQLREKIWPGLRSSICRLVDLCSVAYFAEVIYLGRAYGKSPTASSESLEAMRQIHDIVDSPSSEHSGVDPGFIWPLFMYAVEHPVPEQSWWAVRTLRKVNNPIWHSGFVSDLAQGIIEEQLKQAKRVDTRYFCLKHFSTPPPFI